MYLNLRQPPLRSRIPFPFLRSSRDAPPPPNTPPSPLRSPTSLRPPSPTRPLSKRSPSAVPIPPIPPSSNPRGELIFSSRVDRAFRDSYERYRTAFEKRREEKEREAFRRTYLGRFLAALPWNPPLPPPSPIEPANKGEKGLEGSGFGHVAKRSVSGSSSTPGRGRLGGTPSGSRKSSPAPSRGKGTPRIGGMESRSSTPSSTITNHSTSTASTYTMTSTTSAQDSSYFTPS